MQHSCCRGSGDIYSLGRWFFLMHFCIFDRNDKVSDLIKQCLEPENPPPKHSLHQAPGSGTVSLN